MQVSVRLSSAVERKLETAINTMHKPRNAIINEALEFYLDSIQIEKSLEPRMQAFNDADKSDDLADFGDWP